MNRFLLLIVGTAAWVGLALIVSPTQISRAQANCDPAYPDFCIAPPPPDLDCADISQKSFTVRQPDPHRFDGDKDGIGCEPS